MQTTVPPHLPALSSGLFAVCLATVLVLTASGVFGQAKNTVLTSITSLSQTLPTVAGVPTLLTVMGSGDCKYRVGYTRQGAPMALQTQWTYSSTPQNPFPMRLKMLDATPPGTYTWVASGIEGCMGSYSVSFTVR
jgi:hypothetical protein